MLFNRVRFLAGEKSKTQDAPPRAKRDGTFDGYLLGASGRVLGGGGVGGKYFGHVV